MNQLKNDMQAEIIAHKLDDLNQHMHTRVSREEFEPVKKLIYGLVALMLFTVTSALMIIVLPQEWWREIVRIFK